jgi:hypothetical protein
MLASSFLYGMNVVEIKLHRSPTFDDSQLWVHIAGFCINAILMTALVSLAIFGNEHFVFNCLILTFNIGTSIATAFILNNNTTKIGYSITGIFAMFVFMGSSSRRLNDFYNKVNAFGIRARVESDGDSDNIALVPWVERSDQRVGDNTTEGKWVERMVGMAESIVKACARVDDPPADVTVTPADLANC